MSYTFVPMTDEEINTAGLIEQGVYDFEVVSSERKVSTNGNPMAKLAIHVWDKNGVLHMIFDYLVFTQQPFNMRRIKHFCEATGLNQEYANGQLPEELSKLSGKLKIGICDERPNPNGGMYPKKNVVADYLKREGKIEGNVCTKADVDDDIPF